MFYFNAWLHGDLTIARRPRLIAAATILTIIVLLATLVSAFWWLALIGLLPLVLEPTAESRKLSRMLSELRAAGCVLAQEQDGRLVGVVGDRIVWTAASLAAVERVLKKGTSSAVGREAGATMSRSISDLVGLSYCTEEFAFDLQFPDGSTRVRPRSSAGRETLLKALKRRMPHFVEHRRRLRRVRLDPELRSLQGLLLASGLAAALFGFAVFSPDDLPRMDIRRRRHAATESIIAAAKWFYATHPFVLGLCGVSLSLAAAVWIVCTLIEHPWVVEWRPPGDRLSARLAALWRSEQGVGDERSKS